jgi:hypothetical protein
MSFTVAEKNNNFAPMLIMSDQFRLTFESHIEWIRKHVDTEMIQVDAYKARVYKYDFYSYLNAVGIPRDLHWPLLRLNGMVHPRDFDDSRTILYVMKRGDVVRTMRTILRQVGSVSL